MIGLTKRLVPVVISLLGLCVTVAAVISCDDLSPKTCTDFCLGSNRVIYLNWYGLDCTESPCETAALAAQALASTGGADHSWLPVVHVHLSALPDFSQCDGFICGTVHHCSHSEYDVSNFCNNHDSYHELQVCVSPDGLLSFAKYLEKDYVQATTDCGFTSFEETSVTFARNLTAMKQDAGFECCHDDAIEASLNADITSLASYIRSGPASPLDEASAAADIISISSELASDPSSQPGQASADGAPVQGVATFGLVASAVLALMTPRWV
jgi:hypothetical protein